MQKRFKNVKTITSFDANVACENYLIIDNGIIAYFGKNPNEPDAIAEDLSGKLIIPTFKNNHCHLIGLSSSEIEKVILSNINAGVSEIIAVTDNYLFTKLLLEKYGLDYKIALRVDCAKAIENLDCEKALIYVDPCQDEEFELDEASDFAGKNNLKVFINLFDNLQKTGELNSTTGKLPIHYVEEFGLLDRGGYISGAICCDKEDFRLISQYDFEIVIRPIRDLKKGNGLANIIQIQNAGLSCSLGSMDEKNVDFFQETRALLLGTRGLLCDEDAISEDEAFSYAISSQIEEGQKAKFLVLDSNFEDCSFGDFLSIACARDIEKNIIYGKNIKSEEI